MPPTESSTPFTSKRIFFVDDHPLAREWLASLVAKEPDLKVCGQAEEAAAALATIPLARPDLVVVDLSLPRGSGLDLIKDLRTQFPSLRLLVLSMHDEPEVAERAFRAGAHGYAVKRETGPQIIEAVRTVLNGRFYASASLAASLTGRFFDGNKAHRKTPEAELSTREMAVFRLRGQGRSLKEIALELGVSAKTVSSYDARIKEKLGLRDAGELMREAVLWHEQQHGL